MEKETQLSMKLYDTDLIQDGFLGTKWSNIDHELLSKGEMSTLKTLHMQDGSIQEGKISLIKDKDNEIAVKFHLKKEKLIIPDKILDKELTEEDKLKLQNNSEIILSYKGEQVKVRVDKEINQVVVSGNKEITNVKELGEYKLSDKEQENLLSGGKMKPKVFKGEKGYFMAEVSLTENKKGLVFSNTKQLDKETALEMMKTLNKDNEQDFLAGAFNTVSELKTNTTFEQKEENKLETKENLDVHMLASKLSDKDVEKPQELYNNVKNKLEDIQEQPISRLAGNEFGGGNEWLENENRIERGQNSVEEIISSQTFSLRNMIANKDFEQLYDYDLTNNQVPQDKIIQIIENAEHLSREEKELVTNMLIVTNDPRIELDRELLSNIVSENKLGELEDFARHTSMSKQDILDFIEEKTNGNISTEEQLQILNSLEKGGMDVIEEKGLLTQNSLDENLNNATLSQEKASILDDINYFIEKKDFEKLASFKSNQDILPSKEELAELVNDNKNLTHVEKIACCTILDVDINTHLKNENGLTNNQERDIYREKQLDNQQQKTISKSSNMSM